MKVAVFSYREDEREYFDRYAPQYGAELLMIQGSPSLENVHLLKGCDCASVITDVNIRSDLLDAYKEQGIRFLSTRTIGYEHIDTEYAKKIGIAVANITYSPSSVADYAIMMILMVLRRAKHIMYRSLGQDYGITAIRGRELPNLTVGIVGTGRIGETVARHLTGFGCRLLAHDPYPRASLEGIVEWVTLEELYRQSDVITLHVPPMEENVHMINRESIAFMKDDAVLINTARGPLVDSAALIDALESGKLGGAGLDVVEGDREIYYRDWKYATLNHREMSILNAMPNVLMLPHMAFYTDQAVSDMVERSLQSCAWYLQGKEVPWLVNG